MPSNCWLADLRRRLVSLHPFQIDVVGIMAVLGAIGLAISGVCWVVLALRGRQ